MPATRALARDAVRLRYALLPYNYTAAFENSRTGMPLMRPILFEEPDAEMVPANTISATYLWGPDFLVAPVTEPGATRKEVYFPHPGTTWYDFYTDEAHRGGVIETVKPVAEHIPTYVRAGAFIPMAAVVHSTRDYTTRKLDLHYWHDAAVSSATGELYDDDGQTPQAYQAGKYELVRFASHAAPGRLEIAFTPEPGAAYAPAGHVFTLKVHNVGAKPRTVEVDGRRLPFRWDASRKLLEVTLPVLQGKPMQVAVSL
jgi:alpha-glucosidase (family GH31 glycosyl hydrolase)